MHSIYIAFLKRVLILFLGLYVFPFPLTLFNFLTELLKPIELFYQWLIPWIGTNILYLEKEIIIFTNGSGDTTYDYLLVAFKFVLSIIMGVFWLLYDLRGNKKRRQLWRLFKSGITYYLAYTLISYGMYKIVPIQFSPPSFFRLLQAYGDSSPMGLAWTFFGFSKGYNLFLGLGELTAGTLLLHRKTRLIGTLIALSILSNIVAINFFYDIPVKLFSSLLLLMILIVGKKDLTRICALSFSTLLNDNKREKSPTLLIKNRTLVFGFKWVLVLMIFFEPINSVIESKENNAQFNRPIFYGLYKTDLFILNNDTLNLEIPNDIKWNYMGIEYANSIQFFKSNKVRKGYATEIDTTKNRISFTAFSNENKKFNLHYSISMDTIILKGIIDKDSVHVRAISKDRSDFRLTNRGFH